MKNTILCVQFWVSQWNILESTQQPTILGIHGSCWANRSASQGVEEGALAGYGLGWSKVRYLGWNAQDIASLHILAPADQ